MLSFTPEQSEILSEFTLQQDASYGELSLQKSKSDCESIFGSYISILNTALKISMPKDVERSITEVKKTINDIRDDFGTLFNHYRSSFYNEEIDALYFYKHMQLTTFIGTDYLKLQDRINVAKSHVNNPKMQMLINARRKVGINSGLQELLPNDLINQALSSIEGITSILPTWMVRPNAFQESEQSDPWNIPFTRYENYAKLTDTSISKNLNGHLSDDKYIEFCDFLIQQLTTPVERTFIYDTKDILHGAFCISDTVKGNELDKRITRLFYGLADKTYQNIINFDQTEDFNLATRASFKLLLEVDKAQGAKQVLYPDEDLDKNSIEYVIAKLRLIEWREKLSQGLVNKLTPSEIYPFISGLLKWGQENQEGHCISFAQDLIERIEAKQVLRTNEALGLLDLERYNELTTSENFEENIKDPIAEIFSTIGRKSLTIEFDEELLGQLQLPLKPNVSIKKADVLLRGRDRTAEISLQIAFNDYNQQPVIKNLVFVNQFPEDMQSETMLLLVDGEEDSSALSQAQNGYEQILRSILRRKILNDRAQTPKTDSLDGINIQNTNEQYQEEENRAKGAGRINREQRIRAYQERHQGVSPGMKRKKSVNIETSGNNGSVETERLAPVFKKIEDSLRPIAVLTEVAIDRMIPELAPKDKQMILKTLQDSPDHIQDIIDSLPGYKGYLTPDRLKEIIQGLEIAKRYNTGINNRRKVSRTKNLYALGRNDQPRVFVIYHDGQALIIDIQMKTDDTYQDLLDSLSPELRALI